MVKSIHMSLVFLCVFCSLVVSDINVATSGQAGMMKSSSSSSKPAAFNRSLLPQPPNMPQDWFPVATVNLIRNPADLIGFNKPRPRPLSEKDSVRLEVIPPGLRYFWNDIKSEIEWFDLPGQAQIISELLEIAVQDSPRRFKDLEPKFQEVFGVDYKEFSLHGRTVLSWLISFGSADILSSCDFSQHFIDPRALEQASLYLVQKHNIKHIARMITFLPVLVKPMGPSFKGIPYLLYHNCQKQFTPIESIALLFSELKQIEIVHIAALLPIFTPGHEIRELIEFSFNLGHTIKESHHLYLYAGARHNLFIRYKATLNAFFGRCIPNFNVVSKGQRLSILTLFIEFDNLTSFTSILESSGHLDLLGSPITRLGILDKCIEKRALACARYIMQRYPDSVVSLNPRGGYQAPILRAIMDNCTNLFQLCLEHLTNNGRISVNGATYKLSPIALAILQGHATFLDKILTHFKQKQIPFDLRKELEECYVLMEVLFSRTRGEMIRNEALIPHSIWLYLVKEAQISLDTFANRSLLDLAVLDCNPEIIRIIVEERGFNVNTIVGTGSIRGNALRFVTGHIPTLSILLKLGIDPNISITIVYGSLDPRNFYSEEVPCLARLMTFSNPQFQEFLKSIQFSREAALAAREYAIRKNSSSTLELAGLILQKYEDGTFH